MTRIRKAWTPSNWATWKPFGIGEQRPNNHWEVMRAVWENRSELPYAWRILNEGVCDGCALGTAGLRDWTLDGVHLCNVRLRLLKLNTMGPLDSAALEDAAALSTKTGAELRDMGRLPYPMVRLRGEAGFTRISWDEALDVIAGKIRTAAPARTAYYLTSRGMPNESYYCAQKAVRAMGSNNIDNAARVCHSPSTSGLKETLGAAATTCSYADWLESDLIVFIGSNVANNQPVATKYLHYAKKNGTRVLVVNPYREPGMERYWVPSVLESALFGTRIADRFFQIRVGADVAFLNGVMKILIESGRIDRDFIENHTSGFPELKEHLATTSFDHLERAAGVPRDEMAAFADEIAAAERAVFVWSMGITQHACGVDNVRAIVNLALSKGFVGRTGCGLMPIRGHSGVQGGAEMGAYATAFPGGLAVNAENAENLSAAWGFNVADTAGMSAPEMIDAAHRNELDVLFSAGGNFTEVLPDPVYVETALARVPLRVHMDLVVSRQMLIDPAETCVLLPAATRYETRGGVTQTSTERRVIFSPEVRGRRIGEARPEWEVFLDLARRVKPERADQLAFRDTGAVREEIARVIPMYDGIQQLKQAGDQFQYGGPHLCAGWTFNTADGRAHFSVVSAPANGTRKPGEFVLATRRGKQFNSMVHEARDELTGAARDAVFIARQDAAELELRSGDAVRVKNSNGVYAGRIWIADIAPGNVQVHWPEGNVLIDHSIRAPGAGVPDYNAIVTLERVVERD